MRSQRIEMLMLRKVQNQRSQGNQEGLPCSWMKEWYYNFSDCDVHCLMEILQIVRVFELGHLVIPKYVRFSNLGGPYYN